MAKKAAAKNSPRKGQRPRDRQKMEQRRTIAGQLYLKGETQAAIAKQLGVSDRTVSTYLKDIRDEWLQSRLDAHERVQAKELARIDEIERNAWAAWERSQEDAVQVTAKETPGAGKKKPTPGETTTRTTAQVGDSKWLALALDCVEKRAKILGLYIQHEEEPATEEVTAEDIGVVEIVVSSRDEVPEVLKFADFQEAQAAG